MSRGQSDAIGFVLVFSLIVLTVGTVYAAGYPALEAFRTSEQLENMERAFDVLDDNVDDIVREGAPSRATEIKLNGGTLAVRERSTVTITAVNEETGENFTVPAATRPITYTDGDTTVASSFGAVFRSDDGAAVMRDDPGWLVDDDRAVIPLVVTSRSGERGAIGGQSTVLVAMEATSRGVADEMTAGDGHVVRVNVTVESPRVDAWKRYFESLDMTPVDGDASDGEITYQVEVDRVVVPQTTVRVRLDR
ncbi:hypothetical protein Hbl1158_08055 [Halobaculum sp. CBA1158]|uniref:DUF7289 family protein n=1 Tax=Halobaculum sp. CBA1158 TaxID=2904243 RepID=UPI001F4267B9|nr:hypothetical protein [Halobaculum sp. CBA1158]UIO98516.1 hypothetical protein Hbl1158_08055 [Halobaculum sp. CBA1158]